MIAVIQAGGKGTRLRPYTLALPKPLMPVGDEPVLLILLKWLRKWGVKKSIITTGYLGHLIKALCECNNHTDMKISYSQEPEPLGTVGGLRLLDSELTETFFTVNGDLICDIDLRAFCHFHKKCGGLLTVAITEKDVNVDLGVLDCDHNLVAKFQEKPVLRFKVSMGIYCMEPAILNLIPKGTPFGFDDLVYEMLDKKMPIYVYEHNGFWMDIGRKDDFKLAQEVFLKEHKSRILGC
jgi:NDP-sugar pyrophosphorylase family protein